MMNRLQFLLTKLAEEGAEISQIALKTQQFGLDEKKPNTLETNRERVHAELNDLLAVVQMLNNEFGFGYEPSTEAVSKKMERVDEFYGYSVKLGMVEEDADGL